MIGTPLHDRTAPLNRKLQWREWAGYFAASAYAEHHDIEYNAIREAAALIDVSPLYKYRVSGPDAMRLVDRVITRDATRIKPGQVIYTPWCDEDGKVLDDGTIARLDDDSYRWTSAEPNLRWFRLNAAGLDVEIEETSERVAAIALQGPTSRGVLEAATGESFADLRYFRRRAARVGDIDIDVSRTGYTGDLGYELWVDTERAAGLWDRLVEAGEAFELRAAGILALDIARLEAGLILLDVDYTSARTALVPEQRYSPEEIGLGRLVHLDKAAFVGRRALIAEAHAGGAPRRLVGLELDTASIEALYERQGLPAAFEPLTWRTPVPVFQGSRQVGRATSGTWSSTLKRHIALASVSAEQSTPGTRLRVEWTVEARRGLADARVVPTPFFDPPRKRA